MNVPADMAVVPVLVIVGLILAVWAGLSWRRRKRRLEVAHQQAQARAEALLRQILTVDEYEQLGERGYLEVRSPTRPARTYHVPRGPGRVAVHEGGVVVESLCVGPIEWLPPSDIVLAHKLMIEGDEQEYLHRANRFRMRVLDGVAVAYR